MGILGRDRPQQGTSSGSTIIGSDTQLVGNLTLNDNLHLDGRIEGDIQSDADVTVGQSGRLEGEIRARRVLVSGRVQGRIEAERLEIVAGGVVEGNVVTVDLVIEPGGRFNGSSEIRPEAASTQAGTKKTPPAARNADASTEGSSSPA
ncbi:polymer-forming cytoskeletal protein [Wenzhouxiangella sp. XN79A]|uniref:bactofilin family protein n=1 Tax=Wenzhouxiangella sp. XN79A TaxID=2724193 RepID=UPI00144AF5D0|nr:polymer-forming cytoskeletal protein [Wenzhouxiangella sp. XN79A]NKI33795.1 polymer-forming cytoskeletal protein [Wenzhouxiangella sp. XN79A]